MTTAYTFKISLDCPHCRTGVPVNGFTNELLCSNCLKTIDLSQEWWESRLDTETVDEAIALEVGMGNSSSSLGGMNEQVISGNRPPRCQDCKTEFPTELMQSSVTSNGFSCPGCQKFILVRKATPLALSLIPEADLLVHEDTIGEQLGKEHSSKPEPVLFACMACGAGLPVDGSSRTPKCTHCGGSNYLPDSLWLRLHPAAVSHAFFVTRAASAKPSTVTVEDIKEGMSSDKALRILKDETLDPAILQRMMEVLSDEEDVMTGLAKHKRTTDAMLLKLASPEQYYETRETVAKRPILPDNVIEKLVEETDSDTKKALVVRPGIFKVSEAALKGILAGMDAGELGDAVLDPDFPEWKLFEISEDCNKSEAKRILQAPNVSARVLSNLGKNPENRDAIREHPIFKDLGWLRKKFFFAGS